MNLKSTVPNRKALVVIFGALIAMSFAFYNLYPIVFSDTGTYIYSGHESVYPIDRPIYYGLFIRFFDMGFSLWFVILVQGLIATWVISTFLEKNFNYRGRKALLVIFIGSFCTSLSFTACALVPDIFTPLIFLCFYLFIVNETTIVQKILLFVIIAMSVFFSFSNLLLVAIYIVLFTLSSLGFKEFKKYFKKIALISVFCFSLVLIINTLNKVISGKENPNKGGVMFLIAKMIDIGVMDRMIKLDCGNREFILCDYVGHIPEFSGTFLWDYNSPLYKTDGWNDPNSNYLKMFKHSFTKWAYIELYIKDAFISPLNQLLTFEIGKGWGAYDINSPVGGNVATQFPHEKISFNGSLQNRNSLSFENINKRSNYLIVASLISFLILFKNIQTEKKFLVISMLLFIYANAFVCSVFSGVFDRYQARVTWLIPLIILPIILPLLRKKLFESFNWKSDKEIES